MGIFGHHDDGGANAAIAQQIAMQQQEEANLKAQQEKMKEEAWQRTVAEMRAGSGSQTGINQPLQTNQSSTMG